MSSPHLQAGSNLGRYRLLEEIGSGGMGVVFRAHDEKLQREVAIKIIKPGLLDDRARSLFKREAFALSQLSHPGIQTIFDFDAEGELDYLIVEYIPGQSLDELVAKGPLTREQVIALGIQLAAALAAAHEKGILHRDLKPSNLRVTSDGHLKVLDFGLAKFYEATHTDETRSVGTGLVGTPQYMAAELLMGEPASVASDIYGAGVVLYELATGSVPFRGSLGEIVPKVLKGDVTAPTARNAAVGKDLEFVIQKALKRDAKQRQANARELRGELEAISTGIDLPRPREVKASQKKIIAGVLAVVVVAAVTFRVLQRSRNTKAQGIRSLAVLPLENSSKDAGQDYIAAGMTDQLTSELASLRSLKVISRTSASHYADSKLASPEIAEKLGVDALLEGSMQRSGENIRFTLELIHGSTDEHVWSQVFDRNVKDLFSVQREIAQTVARQINLKISGEEKQQIDRSGTTNPEAYDLYLRAKYKSQTALASREDAQAEIELAEQAVKEDPQFAAGYLMIADASQAFMFSHHGGREFDEKASIAIDKALALNPNSAEAYVKKGGLYYSAVRGWNIGAAFENYRKAIAIDPNFANAHHVMGSELTHAGLNDGAVIEFKRALEFDPENYGAKFRMGRALSQGNHFEEAIQNYLRYGINDIEMIASYGYVGKFDEALRVADELEKVPVINSKSGDPIRRSIATKDREVPAARALIYALQGKRQQALSEIKKTTPSEFGPHFHHQALLIAASYAELGMGREAVGYLQFCAKNGMPAYPVFRDNPSLKKLAGNTEYERFMAELKPRWEQIREVAEGGGR